MLADPKESHNQMNGMRSGPNIDAIVLSCDRYHAFVDHMVRCYRQVWPDHPFRFIVPYQQYPQALHSEHQDEIVLKKCGGGIKETVLDLLEDYDDDQMIYWCMDDKFPISSKDILSKQAIDDLVSAAPSEIGGLLLCRPLKLFMPGITARIPALDHSQIPLPSEFRLLRRLDYSMIWIHQFVRAGIIRRLFESFPDTKYPAKQMDALKYQISPPADQPLYVTDQSYFVFGESTTRGQMTALCAQSFDRHGLAIPEGWTSSDLDAVIGGESYYGKNWSIRAQVLKKVVGGIAKKAGIRKRDHS